MKKLMMMSIWAALMALTMTACSKSDDEDDGPADLTEVNQGCYYAVLNKEIIAQLFLGKGHAILFIDGMALSGDATMTDTTLSVTNTRPFDIISHSAINHFEGIWCNDKKKDYEFTYTRTTDGLKLTYTRTDVYPPTERTLNMIFFSKDFKYAIWS